MTINSSVSIYTAISLSFVAFTVAATSLAADSEMETFRWNEDYRNLGEKPQLSAYESLKYQPFQASGHEGYVTFGGSLRSRINAYDNDRFGLLGGSDGTVWLQRLYGHADIHLGNRIRAFVELSANYADSGGDLTPGPFDKDKTALAQAFLDWQIGNSRWRIGRQEMGLGSARLMGTRDGSNVRRSYDGLRWDSALGAAQWRAFYLQPVDVDEGMFDNTSRRDESVWGLNSTWVLGRGSADIYYLGLDRKDAAYAQGVEKETRHSMGMRLYGIQNGWDWDVEALYQFGDFGDADIRGWTVAGLVGYRFANARWQPRIALSANVASGDSDPDDGKLQTFNPLFPNLAYFEEAAIFAPQNFYNIEPEISWRLTPQMSLALDWNFFWRLEKQDAVYVRGLTPLPNTAAVSGHFVAHTPSVSLDYQWSRHLSMDLSYSHFFAEEVIKRAGGSDAQFLKVQLEWKY
ncbi:alginate export family protein [Pseudomonas sp. OIL-1]|uniref:alginate export family protein n=1 Tax=Pseudomonas sp. OIL-1 TaxID=2706126 RepID=UPI0013A7812B|nr:alginate export family protein [Pseudomonas sp. OIL-1]QIB52324.1 alginate export family protein [Pseudomonas sp. OIL-1]